MEEKQQQDELIKTNFFAKSQQATQKGIGDCGSNCYGCQCPGGDVGPVSAETVGYAGGYAGDLSAH